MPQWKKYSEHWEQWEERLGGGQALYAYKHPDGYEYPEWAQGSMMEGWVRVYRGAINPGRELDNHAIPRGASVLEIMCVIYEMRKKYGGVDDDQ